MIAFILINDCSSWSTPSSFHNIMYYIYTLAPNQGESSTVSTVCAIVFLQLPSLQFQVSCSVALPRPPRHIFFHEIENIYPFSIRLSWLTKWVKPDDRCGRPDKLDGQNEVRRIESVEIESFFYFRALLMTEASEVTEGCLVRAPPMTALEQKGIRLLC